MRIGRLNKVFLWLAFLLPLPSFADKVIGVADGDTLTALHAGKSLKIRLSELNINKLNADSSERRPRESCSFHP